MSRLETMAKRIEEDFPEFIKLIPPTEKSEGLYRRIRHIQIKGECCGFTMSKEQLKEIIAIAGSESVHNPLNYLCRVLGRVQIESTLKTATNRLNVAQEVKWVAKTIKLEFEWQIKFLSDIITRKYSMNDVVIATEIACKKKMPANYLIKMLKNGFDATKLKY